jgi:hypothetical protein
MAIQVRSSPRSSNNSLPITCESLLTGGSTYGTNWITTTMKMAWWHGVRDWGVEHRLGKGKYARRQIANYSLIVSLMIDTYDVAYIGGLS